MKIEANEWQKVPGTSAVEFFPIITKPSIVSSNCYIFAGPNAIVIIDPGASSEQTKQISQIVSKSLAASWRPVWVFLTHCHQDHSQEAARFELPANTEIKRFAHYAGADAIERGDRNLTVAYLYPWLPEVCRARFDCKLFSSAQNLPPAPASKDLIELHTEPVIMPDGSKWDRQWLSLGANERIDIFHTPGHSACSISLQVGSLLVVGDLPFAANPGLCGLDGWNHSDLMETLCRVEWLLTSAGITDCCPGHGYCMPGETMREKLQVMSDETRGLATVDLLNADRIGDLKTYVDELLDETAALLMILSGRLYTVSFYLSLLDEEAAAARIVTAVNIEQIDRTLSEFRRFVEAFNESSAPELTAVLKGVQVARALQQILADEQVTRLLGLSLVRRAQRRLDDFLSAVRGLQFLNAETAGDVNELIAGIVRREQSVLEATGADLFAALDEEELFIDTLTRRLAAHSPARDIIFDFVPTSGSTLANIGSDRLDDIMTGLIEGIAGIGVKTIQIVTDVITNHVVIRLSSRQAITASDLGRRRLNLYNRTLGWLGGKLERREHDGNTEFIIRLPLLNFA
jgi:glyoxylase-like metal-dependent hydrolase (beta-lactamase superfamily II)